MLLLALEAWDDRLVGLTNHTYALDSQLVAIFETVAAVQVAAVPSEHRTPGAL